MESVRPRMDRRKRKPDDGYSGKKKGGKLMGIPVLVMGESGSGKTYSIRNFKPNEVGIFSVEKGRLPSKGISRSRRMRPIRTS